MISQVDESIKDNITYLYLCDGKACSEENKKCCYTQHLPPNMSCTHTSNKEHSLTNQLQDIIPTRFDPLSDQDNILVEHFDYDYADINKLIAFFNRKVKSKERKQNDKNKEDEA